MSRGVSTRSIDDLVQAMGIRITVAYHAKTLKRGTLRAILRQANLTVEELRKFI